jgi:UDP-4-amino-4,6-dideoxy-N-acetyl-beta-L-altrosamine N-acetyltransferase
MAGAGVTLRPLTADDKDRLFTWRNSPEVAAYMYTDHQIGRDEHDRWFAAIEGDARRVYWIIELDGEPVGLANLYDIDRANGRCAWAYYLASPSVRGRGVGGAVEYQVIERVFGELGLRKLWCEVLASNEAVWKLHQGFGFEIEARFRSHVVKGGEPRDVIGLGLLKEDWLAARDAIRERLERIAQRSKSRTASADRSAPKPSQSEDEA